jgi:inorganic pyrophosphatase
MHALHDVALGEDSPRVANAVVEIPLGSKNKYEIDLETGLLRLDRVLSSEVRYPVNYGFFPRTRGRDGEALDALIFGQTALHPLTIVAVRPVGMLTTSAKAGPEPKILAVEDKDPLYGGIRSAAELGHALHQLKQFLRDYKILEGDPVRVLGSAGAGAARAALKRTAAAYLDAGGRLA